MYHNDFVKSGIKWVEIKKEVKKEHVWSSQTSRTASMSHGIDWNSTG